MAPILIGLFGMAILAVGSSELGLQAGLPTTLGNLIGIVAVIAAVVLQERASQSAAAQRTTARCKKAPDEWRF